MIPVPGTSLFFEMEISTLPKRLGLEFDLESCPAGYAVLSVACAATTSSFRKYEKARPSCINRKHMPSH
jgi:hypothetical protein